MAEVLETQLKLVAEQVGGAHVSQEPCSLVGSDSRNAAPDACAPRGCLQTHRCRGSWNNVPTLLSITPAQVGPTDHAICALSGGVDSTVAATLIHKVLGDRLHCVFVDHGLLRYKVGGDERVDEAIVRAVVVGLRGLCNSSTASAWTTACCARRCGRFLLMWESAHLLSVSPAISHRVH